MYADVFKFQILLTGWQTSSTSSLTPYCHSPNTPVWYLPHTHSFSRWKHWIVLVSALNTLVKTWPKTQILTKFLSKQN